MMECQGPRAPPALPEGESPMRTRLTLLELGAA